MGLMDRLFAPVRECVSFPDLLIGLSGINNEPLSDVIYYLSCCDFELLNTYRIGMSHKVELVKNSQDLIHYFLEDVSVSIPIASKAWVFTGDVDSLRLLPPDTASELVGIFDAHVDSLFKISELLNFAPLAGYLGFLESDTAGEEVASPQPNNSLASYMTEYTLPQVVALILHIDLADITTSPNNSYINDQNKYGEDGYRKFENLLQSYSVAALNNKLDGVDLYTRTVTTYGGGTETHVDLEKTSINRSNLASYLSSIGCHLDDLIAKQGAVHPQYDSYQGGEDEIEAISNLKQQVEDLQAQVAEKDKELKTNSKELGAALNKLQQASATVSDNKPLNERSERSYLNTIGLMLELLTKPRNEGGKAPFPSEAAIISRIEERDVYGQKSSKLGERFKEAKDALADEKKKKR